jgi:ABC-2 type transport system ATP-binding protein
MDHAIVTRKLSRKFGKINAIEDVNLKIPKGQVYGFLGPNGCGKSTLIRMLCGLLRPSAGEIETLGFTIPQQAEALKHHTGYMMQGFSLYRDLTVAENLRFIAEIYNLDRNNRDRRIAELIARYDLGSLQGQIAGSLSGGQRQRLALAAALIHKPQLLFLDEPTSAVDPKSRRDFWENLFDLVEQGTTILLSTHFMDEAERCHRLAILDKGKKIIEGAPKQLMKTLGASVVELKTEQSREAKTRLLTCPQVKSVTQLGLNLRVLVDTQVQTPERMVLDLLAPNRATAALGKVSASIVNANLEDVFVMATMPRGDL